tara:strand:- start:490 stop:915 length:426 start_codon:yes stop_codon:yes gene_type:complete
MKESRCSFRCQSLGLLTIFILGIGLSGCQHYDPENIPVARISQKPLTVSKNSEGVLKVNAPTCGPLSNHNEDEYYNHELGCANQYNLAKMIANPEDLEPQDPDREPIARPLIRAYDKYKNGESGKKSKVVKGLAESVGISN